MERVKRGSVIARNAPQNQRLKPTDSWTRGNPPPGGGNWPAGGGVTGDKDFGLLYYFLHTPSPRLLPSQSSTVFLIPMHTWVPLGAL